MLSTSFRNTLIASTLLVGASILTGTAAFAADPTDSGIVGGDVADISTMTFTDPSAPGSTTLATGSGFAMGSLAIRNNDPQGWTLKVQSTNSGQLRNGDATDPTTMYITYSALTAAGAPTGSTNLSVATLDGTQQSWVVAPYDESFAAPAGGTVTVSATIAGAGVAGGNTDVAFDSLPAGTYTDTLTFTLTSNL